MTKPFAGVARPVGPRSNNGYVAGFCGSGVVWATHLGRKVAHKILGSAEGKTVFDGRPFRSRPFYRGKPWFLPGAVAVLGLRDRLPV